jgi:hypothetical protein
MKKSIFLFNALLLFLIFGISVYLRKDNLNKPAGWVSAHTLITLDIWDKEGIAHHHFSPVYTYTHPADKNIPFLGGVVDKNGNGYYVSYPPFAFLLPYFVFKLLGVTASSFALNVFGVCIHFICALLLILIIYQEAGKSLTRDFFLPAFLAFAVYSLAQGNLWFHTNLYFCDMLVLLFFLSGIYFYRRMFGEDAGRINRLMLALSIFFAVYTEWLGIFLAVVLLSFEAMNMYRAKRLQPKLMLAIVLPTILALGLTFVQYSSVAGAKAFIDASRQKYLLRSGLDGEDGSEYGFSLNNPKSYAVLHDHYDLNYFSITNLLCWLLAFYLILCLFKKEYFFTRSQLVLLLLLAAPVVLHNLVFFNFNVVHDLGTLKTSVLFAFLIALITSRFLDFSKTYSPKIFLASGILLVMLVGLKLYESSVHYQEKYSSDQGEGIYERFGTFIRQTAPAQPTLFTNAIVVPELVFQAKRNLVYAEKNEDVILALKSMKRKDALFYQLENGVPGSVIGLDSSGAVKIIRH